MSSVCLPTREITLSPGSCVTLNDVGWAQYVELLANRGETSTPRIYFARNQITLLSPSSLHEVLKARFHDAVTDVLRASKRSYLNVGSFTLQKEGVAGVEADVSYYLDNLKGIRPIIDLAEMRAPDLAIEIDLTSHTDVSRYLPFSVPEIWIYENSKLTIHRIDDEAYREVELSRWFKDYEVKRILDSVQEIDPLCG